MAHRLCAKLPKQLKHPFHTQHVLSHTYDDSVLTKDCSICHVYLGTDRYQCYQCEFTLDFKCAVMTLSKCDELGHHIGHQHPLLVCERPKDHEYTCICCGQPFETAQDIYVCLECNCMMHESCAELPIEMSHPFHPEHPLRFLAGNASLRRCSLCFELMYSSYHCSECSFYLDLDCAKLVPICKGHDQAGYIQIQPKTHPHPLIQCNCAQNFRSKCSACAQPFEDSVYACLQCPVLLHKTCANLPREITHSLHPQHTLTLHDIVTDLFKIKNAVTCRACRGVTAGNLLYFCKESDFSLDIRCATAKLPMIRSDIHHHDLTYFNFRIPLLPDPLLPFLPKLLTEFRMDKDSCISCKICGKGCIENFLRCIECDFNVHDFCYPSLPPIAKHDRHRHPLRFTTSQIKDTPDEDEYDEFYCNACEERRELTQPSYYCAEPECHFVAHVHCVFSKILPYLHAKSMDLTSKEDNVKLQTTMTAASATKDVDGGDENVDSFPLGFAATDHEDVALQNLNEDIAKLQKGINALKRELDKTTAKFFHDLQEFPQVFDRQILPFAVLTNQYHMKYAHKMKVPSQLLSEASKGLIDTIWLDVVPLGRFARPLVTSLAVYKA